MTKTHWLDWTRFCRIYRIWKRRCENKNDISYKNYWWRWIKREWKCMVDFKNDMYESYIKHCNKFWEKNTTLDRINNNDNYYKENCRRVTYKEQQNHRRNNSIVFIFWKTMTVQQAFEIFWKVNQRTFRTRYCRNWDLEDCLLLPPQSKSFSYKKYKNENMARTMSNEADWSKQST